MKDGKPTECFKKMYSNEAVLKRIPVYFLIICVLLTVLLMKLSETNSYLEKIAETGTGSIEFHTHSTEENSGIFYESGTTASDSTAEVSAINEETSDKFDLISTKNGMATSNAPPENSNITTQSKQPDTTVNSTAKTAYIINKSSKKIHLPNCHYADTMKEENKEYVKLSKDELKEKLNNGYSMCSKCGK